MDDVSQKRKTDERTDMEGEQKVESEADRERSMLQYDVLGVNGRSK